MSKLDDLIETMRSSEALDIGGISVSVETLYEVIKVVRDEIAELKEEIGNLKKMKWVSTEINEEIQDFKEEINELKKELKETRTFLGFIDRGLEK
jgi:uncharacterized coiled-coil DUF342 family protein